MLCRNFGHVNPSKKKWELADQPKWGPWVHHSAFLEPLIPQLKLSWTECLLFSSVYIPWFFCFLWSASTLRTISVLTFFFTAGKRSLLSVRGHWIINSQKWTFLKEISSSVCFVIENSDYVPLFHLTFPVCFSSMLWPMRGAGRQLWWEAPKVQKRALQWRGSSCALTLWAYQNRITVLWDTHQLSALRNDLSFVLNI